MGGTLFYSSIQWEVGTGNAKECLRGETMHPKQTSQGFDPGLFLRKAEIVDRLAAVLDLQLIRA